MRREHILIGVVGTEMQGIEQQRILGGIAEQAKAENADIVVLTNLFNPLEPEKADCAENRIFSQVLSPDLNGIIVLSESLVNEKLRENIRVLLMQRLDIPILLAGAALPGFDFPGITTSDANDMEELTGHLIEGHGFRDITLLTGPFSLEVSRTRAEGYRRALENHCIPYDESKVIEGDFWYTSGDRLAQAWISGAASMPEALVCANDYMAFGILDAFENAGINILEHIAVAGYEFIPDRNLHTPLLTTYQRNRTELGKSAVRRIVQLIRGETPEPFTPPRGRLIHGVSCSCNVSRIRQHEELANARISRQYEEWSLKSEMERLLTECRDMDAFAKSLGEFMFLLRGVGDVLLCLFEDWHRPAPASDILVCRSVNPWTDHTEFRLKREMLSGITMRLDYPAVWYWLPICFHDRLFGYCVLRYDGMERYSDVCRSWIKSAANGLEFLRLKADVHYLLQCRVLSGAYDSMTGMFSADGLKNAYRLMQNTSGTGGTTALVVRCLTEQAFLCTTEQAEPVVQSLLAVAGVIQRFQGGICGRISEYEFLLLVPGEYAEPKTVRCAATAELLCVLPAGSFFCTAEHFPAQTPPDALVCSNASVGLAVKKQAENSLLPHFSALSAVRAAVYREPTIPHTAEQTAASLGFNPDYFNRRYKACFGVSFHQDCIRSRVLYAAHLLMQSPISITETAEKCGYTESKYFIRQFSTVTGCPPKAFRNAAGILISGKK